MKNIQNNTGALSALLRTSACVETLETNTLCCSAASIVAPSSAATDARIPHGKLRGATLADATLNAQVRPLAQPVVGYAHALDIVEWPPEQKTGRSDGPTELIGRAV